MARKLNTSYRIRVLMPAILILAFSLPVSVAIAATPTPQATETVQPTLTPYMPNQCQATSIIPTVSIPTSSISTPCPPGVICGHSDGGGLASPTVTVTGTPPTTTPTATVTVTATPLPGLTCGGTYGGDGGFTLPVCEQIDDHTVKLIFDNGSHSDVPGSGGRFVINSSPSTFYYLLALTSSSWVWYQYDALTQSRLGYWGTNEGYFGQSYYEVDMGLGERVTSGPYTWTQSVGSPGVGVYTWVSNGVLEPRSWSVGTQYGTSGRSVTSWWGAGQLYVSSAPIDLSTPTPVPSATSTPDPCGVSGEVVPGEPIASFNPPTYHSGGCYVIFDAVSLDLPDLSWSPLTLPDAVSFSGWMICIQLVTMSAVFAGVDWVGVLAGIVTFMCIGGIYQVLKEQ